MELFLDYTIAYPHPKKEKKKPKKRSNYAVVLVFFLPVSNQALNRQMPGKAAGSTDLPKPVQMSPEQPAGEGPYFPLSLGQDYTVALGTHLGDTPRGQRSTAKRQRADWQGGVRRASQTSHLTSKLRISKVLL